MAKLLLLAGALAVCLSVPARAQGSNDDRALFPSGPATDAALRQPIAASVTCGAVQSASCPPDVFSGPQCVVCSAECPDTGTADMGKITTELGTVPQVTRLC